MSDSRNYSRKFITEFIELYKSLPALWKVKSKEYSDRNKKRFSYQKMVKKLSEIEPNANRELVTKKINSLRSSYRKERKKVTESEKSGAGTENVYLPSLWYFDLLRFVDDQDSVQIPTSNFNEPLVQIQDETNAVSINSTIYSELDSPSTPGSSNLVPPRCGQVDVNESQRDIDNVIASIGQRLCKAKNKDQHDVFGQIVAHKLRNLPNDQRIYLEKLINDAIFEAELGNLSRDCNIHVPYK